MSLTAAQIQSIGEAARENAQAGAPAVLEGAMLEELGIPAKDQGFSLTGHVGSATTSVVALLDATGEILRLRTIPEQGLTGCTPGLATPVSWLLKDKVHSVKHFVPRGSGSPTVRLGHSVHMALQTSRIPTEMVQGGAAHDAEDMKMIRELRDQLAPSEAQVPYNKARRDEIVPVNIGALCLLCELLQRGSLRQDELGKRKELLLVKAKWRTESQRGGGSETQAFNSVLCQIEFWDAAVDAMVDVFEKLALITCGLIPTEASDNLLTAMERDLICVKRRGKSVTVVSILRMAVNQSAAMIAHHACTVASQKIKQLKVFIDEPSKAPESMDNLMEWIAQWLQYDVAQGKINGGPQGTLPIDIHRRGLSDRLRFFLDVLTSSSNLVLSKFGGFVSLLRSSDRHTVHPTATDDGGGLQAIEDIRTNYQFQRGEFLALHLTSLNSATTRVGRVQRKLKSGEQVSRAVKQHIMRATTLGGGDSAALAAVDHIIGEIPDESTAAAVEKQLQNLGGGRGAGSRAGAGHGAGVQAVAAAAAMNYAGTGDGTNAKSKLTDVQKRALQAFNLRALKIPGEEYAKIANTVKLLRGGDYIAYVPLDAKLVVEKDLRKDYIEAVKVLKASNCPRLSDSDYATFKGVICKARDALRAKRKADRDPDGVAAAGGGDGGDGAGKKKRKKAKEEQRGTKELMLQVAALQQQLQELQSAPGGDVSAVHDESSERQGAAERKVTFGPVSTEDESTAGVNWEDFLKLTDPGPTLEAAAMGMSEQTDRMDLYATSEELASADELVRSNGTMAAVQPVDNGLNPTPEQLQHVEGQLQLGDLQLSIHDLDGRDGSDEFQHGLDAHDRKRSKIQSPKTIQRIRRQWWGANAPNSAGRAGAALAMALAPAGVQALEFPPRKVQQLTVLAAGLLIVVGMLGVVVMGLRAHRMARGRGLLTGMALLSAAAFSTAVAATNRFQLLRPVEMRSPSPSADTASGQVEHASGGGRTSAWWLLGVIVVMLIVTVFVPAVGRHYEAVRGQVHSEGPRSYTQFAARQEIFDIDANLSCCPDMTFFTTSPPGAYASPGSPSTGSSEDSAKTDDVEAPVPDGCHMTHVKTSLGGTPTFSYPWAKKVTRGLSEHDRWIANLAEIPGIRNLILPTTRPLHAGRENTAVHEEKGETSLSLAPAHADRVIDDFVMSHLKSMSDGEEPDDTLLRRLLGPARRLWSGVRDVLAPKPRLDEIQICPVGVIGLHQTHVSVNDLEADEDFQHEDMDVAAATVAPARAPRPPLRIESNLDKQQCLAGDYTRGRCTAFAFDKNHRYLEKLGDVLFDSGATPYALIKAEVIEELKRRGVCIALRKLSEEEMKKLTITTANGGRQPRIVAEAFLTLTFFMVSNDAAYATTKFDPRHPVGTPVTVDWTAHVLEGGGSPNMLVGCSLLGSQGAIPVSRVDKGVCTNRVHLKAGTLINTTVTGPVMKCFVDRLYGVESSCPGLEVYQPAAFRHLLERMSPSATQSALKAPTPGERTSAAASSASSPGGQGGTSTAARKRHREGNKALPLDNTRARHASAYGASVLKEHAMLRPSTTATTSSIASGSPTSYSASSSYDDDL